jgi:hypothetical protein
MTHDEAAVCPRCGSSGAVRQKLVLLDPVDHEWRCVGDGLLSIADVRPEFIRDNELRQFVSGLFCESCDVAFVPDHMAIARKQWRLTSDGWCEILPGGSLGPPKQRAD